MVETAEIAVQADDTTLADYIAKRREYGRIHSKKYWETHKDAHKSRVINYKKKMINENKNEFIEKIKKQNKKQYLKRKARGISPEEKAKKAAYMKEYRARKKLEKQINQIL